MAATNSTMLPLGTKASDFSLRDTISDKIISLSDLKSDIATVIMFICNHCPYVIHIQSEVVNVAKKYQAKGISFVAISSNDLESYPADGPENMKLFAEKYGFTYPYLYDETQEVAKAYHAACTPDFYIFDRNLACIYHGRFDDATPKSGQVVTGKELSAALDNVLAGKPGKTNQHPSIGCSIKWK